VSKDVRDHKFAQFRDFITKKLGALPTPYQNPNRPGAGGTVPPPAAAPGAAPDPFGGALDDLYAPPGG
jgi:hypothetical protein